MPNCISNAVNQRYPNTPLGGNPAGTPRAQYAQQGAPQAFRGVVNSLDDLLILHDETVANIRQLTSVGAVPVGTKVTAGMLKELSRIASAEARYYAAEHIALMDKARVENAQMLTRLRMSERSESDFWLRLKTDANERFVDGTAKLQAYFLNFFGMEGRTADQNVGVRDLLSTVDRLRGMTERYERYFHDMLNKARKVLGRNSKATAMDVMRDVGTIATQPLTKMRNDMLIGRWEYQASQLRDAIVKLDAKIAGSRNQAAIDRYTKARAKLQVSFDHFAGNARELRQRRNEDSISWFDRAGNEHKTACCGWLDGEIAKEAGEAWTRLKEYGFTDAAVNELIGDMQNLYKMGERSLVEGHQVSLKQLRRWAPNVEGHLPFVHPRDNAMEAATAVSLYTPGSLRAIQGSTERPANVFDSLHHFIKRSVYRTSMSRLAQTLYNMHRAAAERKLAGRTVSDAEFSQIASDESGLLVTPYRNISSMSREDYSRFMAAVNGGGVVSDIVNAKGEVERVFIRFRSNFMSPDSGRTYTGAQLNDVLNGITRQSDHLNLLGKGTAKVSRLYTYYNLGFSPANGVRDFVERAFNMSNRDYVDERGRTIPGYKIVGAMIANLPRAFRMAFNSAWGRNAPDISTPEGRFVDEFRSQGLDAVYLKDLGREFRSFDSSLDPNAPQPRSSVADKVPYLKAVQSTMGRAGGFLGKFLDAWNGTMNNAPALAQYIAMRELGLSADTAGAGVGEMLNNNLTGTWTSWLRTFFPFIRPTMQGARAMLRSFGLAADAKGGFSFRPRNAVTAFIMYNVASALYAFTRDGLGETDDGAYNMDAISIGTLASGLPFMPNGEGGYLKLPVPFGMSRIALAFAAGQDRVERGVMAPEDFAFAVMSTLGKQVAAGDFPEWSMKENPADWLMQAFAPSLVRPIVDVAVNRNFAGGPIVRGSNQGEDSMEAKSSKGYAATEQWYKDFAKAMFDQTGYDLAPEQVKALMRGYLGGPLRFITGMIESDNPAVNEERQSSTQDLGSFFTALGMTMYYGKLRDADKSLVYGAMDKLRRDVRREGVEWNNPELAKARNPDAYRAWRVQQLRDKGWSESKLADLDLMLQLDSELRKSRQNWREPLMQAFNEDDDGEALRDAFNRKFDEEHSIFRRGVEGFNLYHGGWE